MHNIHKTKANERLQKQYNYHVMDNEQRGNWIMNQLSLPTRGHQLPVTILNLESYYFRNIFYLKRGWPMAIMAMIVIEKKCILRSILLNNKKIG